MASEFPGRPPADLSRLTDSERRVLRLLTEGHTAKSIANITGASSAAINERLREARRKTGVSSSRELARLLKAQENRPEQIEVSSGKTYSASLSHENAGTRRSRMGVFAMSGIFGTVLVGAAALVVQVQSAEPPRREPIMVMDPDLGSFGAEGPAWMYSRIRNEPVDANWAPIAERALRERYASISFFGQKPRVLRVMCRTRTCEVAMSIPRAQAGSNYGEAEASINRDLRKQGLIQAGALLPSKTSSGGPAYLAYFLRHED